MISQLEQVRLLQGYDDRAMAVEAEFSGMTIGTGISNLHYRDDVGFSILKENNYDKFDVAGSN